MLASNRQVVVGAKNKVGQQVSSLTCELFTSQLQLTCDLCLAGELFGFASINNQIFKKCCLLMRVAAKEAKKYCLLLCAAFYCIADVQKALPTFKRRVK